MLVHFILYNIKSFYVIWLLVLPSDGVSSLNFLYQLQTSYISYPFWVHLIIWGRSFGEDINVNYSSYLTILNFSNFAVLFYYIIYQRYNMSKTLDMGYYIDIYLPTAFCRGCLCWWFHIKNIICVPLESFILDKINRNVFIYITFV